MSRIEEGGIFANYHTHTWRCNHAQGTEREYIETAIRAGMRILGFADHTPYPFPEGHVSGFRMRLNQLDDYCKTLTDLKREYQNDIEIHIGLEAEYYPSHFEALLRYCEDYPIEYFVQGQHFTHNEYDGWYSGRETKDEQVLADYCAQALEGQRTGRFLYLAHPDLIHYTGDAQTYERHMRALCKALKPLGRPIEFNLLGFAEHRPYPVKRFWEIAGEEGLTAVLGCDAHQPEALYRPQIVQEAKRILEKHGVPMVRELELPTHV